MSPFNGRKIKPMKAGSGELPTAEQWVYELKWDGMRVIAFVEDGEVRLQTSNQIDATERFPELAGLATQLDGMSAIVDGEVVAFDEQGKPSFGRLQERIHVVGRAAAEARVAANPVVFVAFDILHLNGHDTMGLPWSSRRQLLEQIMEDGPSWRITSVHESGGEELLNAVIEQGLEGLVAKQVTSTYREGSRGGEWRKIKPRRRQEFVVGGWLTGEGHRQKTLGSLLVGVYNDDGDLEFAGRVGSGLNDAELKRLLPLLKENSAENHPFTTKPPRKPGRDMFFVHPKLVVEVAFAEWPAGHQIRHPSYLGQRMDVNPTTIRREP